MVDEVDVDEPDIDKAANCISSIDFSNPAKIRFLRNCQDMASLGLSDGETLLVERPEEYPGAPPAKRFRLEPAPDDEYYYDVMALELYRTLWKQPEKLESLIRTETLGNIPGHAPGFPEHFKPPFGRTPFAVRFLIRQEFDEALEYMEERPDKHILLLGQSDIGKTISLTYFLVMRLVQGLPTAFAATRTARYLSEDSGVTCWKSGPSRIPYCSHPNYRVLGDLNCHQSIHDLQITSITPTSVSSSPQGKRYKRFEREGSCFVKRFIMKPSNWLEVYSWARSSGSSAVCDFQAFQMHGGPSMELAYTTPEQLDSEIAEAIDDTTLKNIFCNPEGNWDLTHTHHIIEMRPLVDIDSDNMHPIEGLEPRGDYTINFLSTYVYEKILERKRSELAETMRYALEVSFLRWARPIVEFAFQDMIHKYLCQYCTPKLLVLRPFEGAGNNYYMKLGLEGHRQLKVVEYVPDCGEPIDLSADRYYKLPTGGVLDPLGSGRIDLFALEVDASRRIKTVAIFQFALPSSDERAATIRIRTRTREIIQQLQRHLEKLDWKSRLGAKEIKWKLVFAVPQSNKGKELNLMVKEDKEGPW
ncbi:hypothetical protein EST38_g8211 [Candolleomyces aberdarensis]|uniref:Uncharacterized protein n=1 Tax=Candolleomyces aberdarensis TaxID=2316362 RepID=A0A4Q2DEY5_9AGAR|nr:hypothetical protein EST38_g8211 [Candolleomyces aberdarensis]